MEPVPRPPLYIDLISQIKFGPKDILMLVSNPVARPSWLGEQKIVDLVQYPVDKRIVQRLVEMTIIAYPHSQEKGVGVTAIWSD